ncbi:unnamed protein product [Rhizoctonia solani]|uniref:SAM-dependent MTase RsmB/NOP-type domain-containing protein n=1 Tax=Rhizoctonia solani TaxID=456999 RepID=A0A8H3DL40_9AGAM|nr:unnamed protein product [Rhizoctonia solani]
MAWFQIRIRSLFQVVAMGKRGKKAGGGKQNGGGGSWGEDAKMENEAFEKYYKAVGIVSEAEWDEFWASLKVILPTTFRVTGSRATAQELNSIIKEQHVPSLKGVEFEGQVVQPPRQLPWYPDGLGWQLDVSKSALRKTPEFKRFHNFLVYETEVGNISRQEAVSMIPPLLLDVQPHHTVIDMCAAPGSKTAQLLEALHANDTAVEASIPSGLLIANDTDNKRAHMLVHQSSRLPSPVLMVTNLDASIYPRIQTPSGKMQFDRILCDVPCSGDGTMRKNFGIWKSWTVMNGNGLHGLQLRILIRAMNLLKPGGRLVYSTCSMNPVENEAVIAAALKKFPHFELLDVSTSLPELKRRPGLSTWRPAVNREMDTSFSSYADFIESLPENKRSETKIQATHWPPPDVEQLNLERCLRIYPHLQNTGAFFVAVLHRKPKPEVQSSSAPKRSADAVSESSAGAESSSKKQKTGETMDEDPRVPAQADDDEPAEKPGKVSTFKELPYVFLSEGSKHLEQAIADLQIKPSFPSTNLFVRNPDGEALRHIYLCNDAVRQVLAHNDFARLRLISAGVRVFNRQESGVKTELHGRNRFRFLTEGVPSVLPHVDESRIVTANLDTLRVFMRLYYPVYGEFSSLMKEIFAGLETGSYLMRVEPSEHVGISLKHALVLPIWKSTASVALMLDKKAKSALSLRLWGEDVTPAAPSKTVKTQTETAQDDEAEVAEEGNDDGPSEPVSE